jgi:hypothetical protein
MTRPLNANASAARVIEYILANGATRELLGQLARLVALATFNREAGALRDEAEGWAEMNLAQGGQRPNNSRVPGHEAQPEHSLTRWGATTRGTGRRRGVLLGAASFGPAAGTGCLGRSSGRGDCS